MSQPLSSTGLKGFMGQGLALLCLGFSSALPFLLVLSTLSVWLVESGAGPRIIGFFSLVTLPYTLKFLWSPLVDRIKIPYLTHRLGKRRSWALLSQISLMVALVSLGATDPRDHFWGTGLCALLVSFCASFQDLIIEAYRLEITTKKNLGLSASSVYLGFRLGLMTSGAGALYLASMMSWFAVYTLMALCISVGMITILCIREPADIPFSKKRQLLSFWLEAWRTLTQSAHWKILLIFLVYYKATDTILHVMDTPFFLNLGYTKLHIAEIGKFFGIGAMMVGGLVGGFLLNHASLRLVLITCVLFQIVATLSFVVQALVGYDILVLIVVVGLENLVCGISTTALLAYYSVLCRPPHTATHYALLSSLGSLTRILWSSLGGMVAEYVSWSFFFALVTLFCLPALWTLIRKDRELSL